MKAVPSLFKNNHPLTTDDVTRVQEFDMQKWLSAFDIHVTPNKIMHLDNRMWKMQTVTIAKPTQSMSNKLDRFAKGLVRRLDGIPITKGERACTIICMQPLRGHQSFNTLNPYTSELNLQASIQGLHFKAGGVTYKGTEMVFPLHFAGYSKDYNMYVMCSGPHITWRQFSLGKFLTGKTLPKYTLAAEKTIKGLMYAGFVITKDIRESCYGFPSNANVHVKVHSASHIMPLPVSIHRRLVKMLDAGASVVAAWQDSGGYEWHRRLSKSRIKATDNVAVLQQLAIDALSFSQGEVRDHFVGMVPFFNSSKMSPEAGNVDNISHITKKVKRYDPNYTKPESTTILDTFTTSRNVRQIGKGEYGAAYESNVTASRVKFLESLVPKLSNLQFHRLPDPGREGKFIIKFQTINHPATFANVLREAYILKKVSSAEIFRVKSQTGATSTMKGSTITPTFFFSGTIGNKHVICMGKADGNTLYDTISRTGSLPRPVFKKLERAVEFLLRVGIVHSDLHANNVMVHNAHTRNPKISLIDFGMAIELPQKLKTRVVSILNKTGSIENAWSQSGLQNVVNMHRSDFKWFHSNLSMLRFAAILVDRKKINSHSISPQLSSDWGWFSFKSTGTGMSLPRQ